MFSKFTSSHFLISHLAYQLAIYLWTINNAFVMTCPQNDNELTDHGSMIFSVQNYLTFWPYCIQVVGRLLGSTWPSHYSDALRTKATIQQVTTMLATSKHVLVPGHNHRYWWLNTSSPSANYLHLICLLQVSPTQNLGIKRTSIISWCVSIMLQEVSRWTLYFFECLSAGTV